MIYKEIKINNALARTYVLSNYKDYDENRRRAMIIICPGGSYRHCSEREAEAVAVAFNAKGYNSLVLYYTTNNEEDQINGLWPKPQEDLAMAIKYVRSHADELNTDPNKIIIMGFSAGGHLAASLAVHWKNFGGVDIRPDAVVLCYPVITSGSLAHKRSILNLIGKRDELIPLVSLENHINRDTPPTFIWTTKTDKAVPYENSLMFKNNLDKYGVKNKLVIFDNGIHGLSLGTEEVIYKGEIGSKELQSWPTLVDNFLLEIFKSRY